jgi:hypothetical protein
MLERSIESSIDNMLINHGWIIDTSSENKNVFHQGSKFAEERKKLKGKRFDFF